ncbi:MAG TPA: maleylpyruvate isomerase family mycothiol-dependent enzyme [Streptosporangiaceae bacterium]
MSQSAGAHSVGETIARIEQATERLIASGSALSDEQIREPSRLPGWTRGHVLTHVARNADGLANLLTWAQTGEQTPQYASVEERDAQIEAGAGRPAAEIVTDLSSSAQAFVAQARELPEEAWLAQVQGLRGPWHPAWFTLHRRLHEVEIHHVDLAAGYAPSDWPDALVTDLLYRVTGQLVANPETPDIVVTDSDTGRQFLLRPAGASGLAVTGPGHALLAWLLGRDDGSALSAEPAGPLPTIPPF